MYVNEIVNLKLAEAIENPIKLIENIKSVDVVKDMVEDELRRRHKSLSKNSSKTGKNVLKDNSKK